MHRIGDVHAHATVQVVANLHHRRGLRGDPVPEDDDLDVLGYWVASQAPPVMQTCHHLHGGMGMDVTYPMHRYYSTIKDLTRLLGGPSHRLDLVGAQCSSN